ncbi:hypothetical protein [Halarchaeum grantii]|nr:hypothetical protein [Halarchaeum grantii]
MATEGERMRFRPKRLGADSRTFEAWFTEGDARSYEDPSADGGG